MKQVIGICTKNRTLASCDDRVLDSLESSWADSCIKGQKCSDILRITVPFFMVLRMTSRHTEYWVGAVVSVEYLTFDVIIMD